MRSTITILSLVLLAGCDEAPNNTELCREIYTALCHRADVCGTIESLDDCIVFYREDCLVRRLPGSVTTPTDEEAVACVEAISELNCGYVDSSNIVDIDECSFLIEPNDDAGPGDSGSGDAGGGDGDADADTDGTVDGG